MLLHTLPLGPLQANCYLLPGPDGRSCCIIDPGAQAAKVLAFLREQSLQAEAILLTHGHFDHVGGVKELAEAFDCPVYLHPEELSMPSRMTRGPLYHTHTYDEGTILTLAGLTLRVLHTPGHSPGSVCLLCQDALFSGDTLFAGGIGRTDFPGGSIRQLEASLRRLAALEGDLQVYPGHAEPTTLNRERQLNPYFQF